MNKITIFHNPACGTSRNTLALIRHAGMEPEVIEYLKTPPSREKLCELIRGERGLSGQNRFGSGSPSSSTGC